MNMHTLRALGAGVDRLMDGDLKDRSDAEKVIGDLLVQGFVYDYAGHFTHQDAILVNSHMHPQGTDTNVLTDAEKEKVIRLQGALLPEMEQAINESRYLDLPPILLASMAEVIRNIRWIKSYGV